MSFEAAERVLMNGELSEEEIQNRKEQIESVVKSIEKEEIALNVQELEKLFGWDLALSSLAYSKEDNGEPNGM